MNTREVPLAMTTARIFPSRGSGQMPSGDALSCVVCGRVMIVPHTIDDVPVHPDCFTRLCVAALAGASGWRYTPYMGWTFHEAREVIGR